MSYLDYSDRSDRLSGGVRLIPIQTPAGTFRVWTKRTGNNPRIKVLLLHGGPGVTHEYLEAFDSYFPAAGIEYYFYDQLGSHYSDQPDLPELCDLARFVEEVEQVPGTRGGHETKGQRHPGLRGQSLEAISQGGVIGPGSRGAGSSPSNMH